MSATPNLQTPVTTPPMLHALVKVWWLILLRGLLAVLFGVSTALWPVTTLVSLVLLYGVFALVDGMVAVVTALVQSGTPMPNLWLSLVGIAGIAASIVTLLWPEISAIVLVVTVGAWAVAHGIFEIVGAIQLRRELNREWWLLLSGILSVLFGFVMLLVPGPGALGLIWAIAAYSITYGITWIALAFRLRLHHTHVSACGSPHRNSFTR